MLNFVKLFLLSALINNEITNVKLQQVRCGKANNYKTRRIVNGTETSPHKYPWMAAMFVLPSKTYFCGGSVISTKHILTAAHCLDNNYKSSWILGMHELSYDVNNIYNAAEKKNHPDFIKYPFWIYFDFTIVVLDRTITFNENVSPICLPSLKDRFEGKMLTLAGWGATGENQDNANKLREVKLELYKPSKCKQELSLYTKDYDHHAMVCAYAKNKDACSGDSGGPLFFDTGSNHHVIFGTVSFGKGCAQELPAIYGRVNFHKTLDWIKKIVS